MSAGARSVQSRCGVGAEEGRVYLLGRSSGRTLHRSTGFLRHTDTELGPLVGGVKPASQRSSRPQPWATAAAAAIQPQAEPSENIPSLPTLTYSCPLQEARRAAKEAASAAAAAAAANRGLSEAELRAMPLPSASRLPEALAEGVDWEADAALGESPSAAAAPIAPPQQGVSFARITRMGFAATGPSLGIGGDSAGSPGSPSGPGLPAGPPASVPAGGAAAEPAGPALRGAWGAKAAAGTGSAGVGGGASSSASTAMGGLGRAFAELGVRPGAGQQQQQQGQEGAAGAGKGKGKKGKQMLLLSTAQRRY